MHNPSPQRLDARGTQQARFDLLLFDWDGTAVPDRDTPILELLAALERILKGARVICVVVTGTNVDHLLKQGLDTLSRDAKQYLYLCTNRGSEVWAFDVNGKITTLQRRAATPDENAALDRAVARLQSDTARLGLRTEIISNRLNRRKLDLIPEARWDHPKKAEFADLLRAVTTKLRTAGIRGGLSTLIKDAYRDSQAAGLKSARITTDIKHIEIGLTDKSDSARWAFEHLIVSHAIPVSRVAVLGDEIGPVGGIQGSDALLRIPDLQAGEFFSVGIEPEGVPSWVTHLSGGPRRFIQFLNDQANLRVSLDRGDQDISWRVIQEGFEPSRDRQMETLFALGNGYLGVRGSSDFPVPTAQPDLFIAGVYDGKAAGSPYSEVNFHTNGSRTSLESEIVPFPSPFQFRFSLQDGPPFTHSDETTARTRTLNLQVGRYEEAHVLKARDGTVRILSSRFASLHQPHILLQKLRISADHCSAGAQLDFSMELTDTDPRYPHLIQDAPESAFPLSSLHVYKTRGSGVTTAIASRVFSKDPDSHPGPYRFALQPTETVEFNRVIAIFTSRDTTDPAAAARALLANCLPSSFEAEFHLHAEVWRRFWSKADLSYGEGIARTQAQRFNLYHLRIAAGDDSRISIPAKALSGRAYEGHVFWDSEIFMFPFLLYSEPELARNILLYRFNTLDGARSRARGLGYRGASYAWESTLSGSDVTPKSLLVAGNEAEIPIFTGDQEIHVTADVAYAVSKYWDATLDIDFLGKYGAEILAETARFWISRVSRRADAFYLTGVVGPDEYHHDVEDNAYTNWMARFNLEQAALLCALLRERNSNSFERLASKIALQDSEIREWHATASRLFVPQADSRGIIEQFRGFHQLSAVKLPEVERHHAPVSRLLKWNAVNSVKLVKQADVLMIPFLFPDRLPEAVIRANYEYYEPLTDHGSSLSSCVHGAIAARIGCRDDAIRYWEKGLYFDLTNAMSNTGLGIHAAAIGGTWQALVFHFLGVEFTSRGPRVRYPDRARALLGTNDIECNLTYRGRLHPIRLGDKRRQAA